MRFQDNVDIDEVVVSANRQATLRRLAPTLVNVVDSKVFESANANNLAQGLVFQPGVRVENNCQNCGFNQVRINGLDGRYSQILIDSRPIMSALAGVYGLEQIPTNMIDRVEVVRGGGSALFGSSAIAGVINIITKEPTTNSVSFSESLGATGFKDIDNNLAFNASVVSQDGRAGAMLFGQARYRHEHDINGDNYSELGRLDSRALGFRGYLRLTDLSRLTGEVHTFAEARRGGDHIDWPEAVAGVAESIRHSVYSGNIKYDAFSRNYKDHFQLYASAQHITRNSYYGGIGEVAAKDKDGSRNGITYFIRHNYGFDDQKNKVSSGAKVYGVNLEGKLAYHWMSLQAGLTLTSNMYDAEQEWGVRAKIKDDANIDYKTFVPKADGSSFDAIADENGDAQTVSMTSKHIMRTPSVYGYMTLNLNPIKPLNISLTGTYTGSMYVPHAVKWGQNSGINDRNAIAAKLRTEGYELPLLENNAPNNPLMEDNKQKKATPEWNELIKSKPFFDLGAKVSYDFRIFSKTDIQLFMGVNNIFNAFQDDYDFGPNRDSAYIYGPTMPASGYVGFKLNL